MPNTHDLDRRLPPLAVGVISAIAASKFLLHSFANLFGPYEFHRDEFLYFAMGDHLRLWHMDFPPFIAMVSETTRWLLGDSLFALRLPPALASIALLVIAALTARELGGGRFAQGLAAFAVLANSLFLRTGNLFQPVAFDQLWWTIGLFALVKLCRTDEPRWWLAFGVACGFGLLSKFSVLIFGFATFVALLVTPARRWLATPWPWVAGVIAFAIGSPSFVGQITLGFPLLDQMEDLRGAQLARVTALSFIVDQPRMGLGFLLAVLGAGALATGRTWRAYRLVGWTGIFAFVTLIVLHGKSYYIGPIYPVLYGAGAVILERFRVPRWGAVARWGMVTILAVYLAVLFPLGLPVLPPATMDRYLVAIGLQSAAETNRGDQERIPQDYADMLNWELQVQEVARVYRSLPPGEREQAVILASNYGEAGAIDFYGPRYQLPSAVSFVGSYWFFGPGALPGEIIIMHGFRAEEVTDYCGSLTPRGQVTHPYAVSEERDLTLFICRETRQTLQEIWPSLEGEN